MRGVRDDKPPYKLNNPGPTHAVMSAMPARDLDEIVRWLEKAHWMLSATDSQGSEEWLLIASIIAGADRDIRALQRTDPTLEVPLLGEVLAMLRRATSTPKNKQAFLAHTKPARRDNPDIFTGIV